MESLYLLIPISLVFIVFAVRIFFWAVNSGQYDDLDSEGERILFDDDPPENQIKNTDEHITKRKTKSKTVSKNKSEGKKEQP
jgi:cbb3-type cytochrome oxidase maturation protein